MTSNAAPTVALADVPAVPTVAEQADRLRQLDERLEAMHQVVVDVVDVLADVVGTGIVETVEGLPVDHWLRLRARMIHADAASLVTAADVLPSLPVTWGLFRRGVIAWGTARNLADKLGRRSFADRMLIDERIGATQRDWGQDLDGWSGNRLLDEIDRAITELDDLRDVHEREDREPPASYVAVQPSLDGRVRGSDEASRFDRAREGDRVSRSGRAERGASTSMPWAARPSWALSTPPRRRASRKPAGNVVRLGSSTWRPPTWPVTGAGRPSRS